MEDNKYLIKIVCLIIIWTLMFYLIGWVCGWMIGKKNHPNININKQENTITENYKHQLDSIKYNIIIKDTIIYRIQEEMKNEVKQVQQFTDTASVNKFYELVSE